MLPKFKNDIFRFFFIQKEIDSNQNNNLSFIQYGFVKNWYF